MNVSASQNFWDIVQDFEILETDTGEKYDFEKPDSDYNYSFSYDYYIKTKQPIVANGTRVNQFYGVHNSLSVTYENIVNILFNK